MLSMHYSLMAKYSSLLLSQPEPHILGFLKSNFLFGSNQIVVSTFVTNAYLILGFSSLLYCAYLLNQTKCCKGVV
jgi:hypothetical protein